jgi:CHAD domain-containing protein
VSLFVDFPPNPSMNVRTSYDGLWRKRLRALNKAWPEFLAGEIEALHKARVASRRIREALPVIGVAAPPAKLKKLEKKMRNLTRHLGPIRELDVELGMIEQRAADDELSRTALAVVRRDVAAQRQALRRHLAKDPPVKDIRKLIKKLERITDSKQAKPSHQDAWRAALAATLMRRAKKLKAAVDDAGALYASERLHAVRIAIKKLRYALEIAEETGQAGAKPLLKTLKREQDRLGHLHDVEALLAHVREAEASPRIGARAADLRTYADTLERDCRALHAEFVEDRDALMTCVHDVRHGLVPALTTRHLRQAPVRDTQRRPRRGTAKRA